VGWGFGRDADGRGGEVAQTMYTHVSKFKNNKIKERKKKRERNQTSVGTSTIQVFKE
jgi:5S rRNA maturation endonuclease (ribonuclease M5)